MHWIKAIGSEKDMRLLAAKCPYGAVRATVDGTAAIVAINSGTVRIIPGPITASDVFARRVLTRGRDIEAEGTVEADNETQTLIDGLKWEAWPNENQETTS